MTCQSLRDARFSVLELFSKMYHSKLHSDSLLSSDHVGTPLRKTNMAAGYFFFSMSKLFVFLNFSYSHFSLHTGCSDLKNGRWINFFMCVIYVSQQSPLCHGLCKKYEIQFASFSKQSGLPSWKHASRYISKCCLPDEDKTAKFGECSGMQINSCGHAIFGTLLACEYSSLPFSPATTCETRRRKGHANQKNLMLITTK